MKIEVNVSVNYTLQLIDSSPEWISPTLFLKCSRVRCLFCIYLYTKSALIFVYEVFSYKKSSFKSKYTKKKKKIESH